MAGGVQWFNVVLLFITSVICSCLLIVHSFRFFRDENVRLCSKQPDVKANPVSPDVDGNTSPGSPSSPAEEHQLKVSVGSNKSGIIGRDSKKYILVGYLTYLSCLMYAVSCVVTFLHFTITFNITICWVANVIALESLFLAKFFMWLLFIVRLDMIFGNSSHGYKKRTLSCIGIIATLMSLFIIVLSILVFGVGIEGGPNQVYYFHDYNKTKNGKLTFPASCDEAWKGFWWLVDAGSYLIFDLIMNIVYCSLFVIPLRKINKSLDISNQSSKIIGIARKVTILTVTLCISSIISFFANPIGLQSIWTIDLVVNILCLILMTPYYNDIYWYNRLCKCCILCCDKEGYSVKTINTNQLHVQGSTAEAQFAENMESTVASSFPTAMSQSSLRSDNQP